MLAILTQYNTETERYLATTWSTLCICITTCYSCPKSILL